MPGFERSNEAGKGKTRKKGFEPNAALEINLKSWNPFRLASEQVTDIILNARLNGVSWPHRPAYTGTASSAPGSFLK